MLTDANGPDVAQLRSSGPLQPLVAARFFGGFPADGGALFAGLVIALVPLAVVFALATRHVVAGLTAGMSR